jgi:hypothetical protein
MGGSSLGFSPGAYHLTEDAATALLGIEGLGTLAPYGTPLATGTRDANHSLHSQAFACRNFPAVPFLNDFPPHQVDWSFLADTWRPGGFDEGNPSLSRPYIHNA